MFVHDDACKVIRTLERSYAFAFLSIRSASFRKGIDTVTEFTSYLVTRFDINHVNRHFGCGTRR